MSTSPIFRPARLLLALIAAAALVGGFFLATAVFGQSSPSGPEFSRPKDPGPSANFTLRPEDPAFADFVTDFAEFPIYWAGNEIAGLPLDFVVRNVFSPADGSPPENSISFFYGDCVFEESPAEGACSRPLIIVVRPYCLIPPEMITRDAAIAGTTKVRGGADALSVGGGVRIWTGDATVKIYASSLELSDAVTAALVSPNALGTVRASDDLPAPNRDCSGYEMVPFPSGAR